MYNLEWVKRQVSEAVNSTDTAFYVIGSMDSPELNNISKLVDEALCSLEDALKQVKVLEGKRLIDELNNA